ncbi:MAG: hypothetical protein M0019_00045 [Actinomycetota bacterium]|nr:hypothetical protein [Actinomycetota bacterium]
MKRSWRKVEGREGEFSRPLLVVLIASLVLVGLLAIARVAQVNRSQVPIVNAVISPNPMQSVDGFGASGAWWSGPIYSMSNTVKERVGSLLFSKNGLALSQFRYNIGGGGVGVSTPWKRPPSFLQSNGAYNFNADPAGIYFAKLAERYKVTDLIAFVNSAPPPFTSNHLSCAGHLLPSQITSYVNYLVNVVVGMKNNLGITVNYLSPMNEPDSSMAPCKQEGMRVPVFLRARLVSALGRALALRAPWVKIIADETSQVAPQLLPEINLWINRDHAKSYIAFYAHHTYDYPNPRTLEAMAETFKDLKLHSWMTEICCFNGSRFGYQYDPTMVQGMWLAKTIFNDFFYGRDSAFQWWTAISPNLGCEPTLDPQCPYQANLLGRNDGLIYYDSNYQSNGNQNLYLTKRYYVLGNYSKFFQVGTQLHQVTGLPAGVEALAGEKDGSYSIVVIDDRPPGSPPIHLSILVPTKIQFLKVTGDLLTNSHVDWGHVPDVTTNHNIIQLSSSPQSVSSVSVAPNQVR